MRRVECLGINMILPSFLNGGQQWGANLTTTTIVMSDLYIRLSMVRGEGEDLAHLVIAQDTRVYEIQIKKDVYLVIKNEKNKNKNV